MSESAHQTALISWWDLNHNAFYLPKAALFAIPNGGARNAVTGAKLKREGVRAGVFDLCLPVPRNGYAGLWVELKYGKNKLSEEQQYFKQFVEANNGKCVVCWDWLDAKNEIEGYLNG